MRQKRFLSWLLTLCLLLGMFSFPAYAEGNTTTISGDGTDEKTGTMTVTLVIPKKTPAATDLTYTAPSELTYSGSDKVATVAAASGVTGLGNITVKYYSDANRTTEAAPKNVGTYYVGATVAEGDQYAASTAVLYGVDWTFEITKSTPTAPAAPTKASATKNSITLNAVGGCEYSKDSTSWQDSPVFSDLVPSTEYTFYQRIKATANTNVSEASNAKISTMADTYAMTITLKIGAEPTVTAPTAKTGLIANGSAQPLVNAGTVQGGTMQYAHGENPSTAPNTGWGTSIPTATNAGTYYVWYKVIGDENHADSEAKCVTVTIGRRSSSGGGSSGGSSSSPSTPTTPTESYTVPVSSENTVNVTTNISNGTAVVSEITQSDIDKIVDNGNNSGGGDNTGASENTSITIDVSQAKSEVTSVQLSEKTVEKLTEAVKADNNVESVEIKMTNATIELDGAALSAVSEQAEGSSIKLVVEDTQTTKLNATQQESLRQFASAKPFQAYFESNGKEIHDFKGGKATVSIKFSPESGRDVKHYHMYYLPVAGAIERYVTRYVDGMLSFVTTHFSDYAIVYDETMENETGKDDGTGGGSSEMGGESNGNTDGAGTDSESENGSQTDSSSGNTANGKTTYQNAISINKGLKVSQTGSKINVSWGKVSGADRYEVYAAYCGKKFGKSPVKIITGAGVTSAVIRKLDGTKLNLKKNFKVYVVAYKTADGVKQKLGKTITAHVIGRKNKTYTNVKAIKLEKSKTTIKKGKTWAIKATVVLVDPSKKMLSDSHAPTFRYASSNKKIAAVNKSGKVTAKKKGTCYIWVYAKNGYAKKIKVTVQ